MSQSLGNEIKVDICCLLKIFLLVQKYLIHRKVCNLEPSVGVAAPSLQLLHCSASSQAVSSTNSVTYHHHQQQQQLQHREQSVQQYEEIRQNQIQSLAEELRKTSLKNVTTTSSSGGPQAEVGEAPVPAPRRPKQRARRNSEGGGRWRITSFSVEESAAAAQSGAALQSSQEGSSRVTQGGQHVSQSRQFSCRQESGEHANIAAAGQQCTSQQSSTGQQGRDTRSGVMKHVPSFLSLLPRRQDPEPRPAPAPAARRASVSCVPGVSGRSSRAPSVESAQSRARPIFSFLRQGDGQQDNPHRTRCRYFIRVKNILLHIAGRILH